jgi:hypothetical protein
LEKPVRKTIEMNRKIAIILVLFSFTIFIPSGINSQEEQLIEKCITPIRSPFIPAERSLKAFLTGEETAEFRTTFYQGNTYRIVACSFLEGLIEFSIYDTNRKLLFSSSEFNHPNVWDFKMEGSMECIIQAKLNPQVAQSGMVLFMIGFMSNEMKS